MLLKEVIVLYYDICMLYMSVLLLWCDLIFVDIFIFNFCKIVIILINVKNI